MPARHKNVRSPGIDRKSLWSGQSDPNDRPNADVLERFAIVSCGCVEATRLLFFSGTFSFQDHPRWQRGKRRSNRFSDLRKNSLKADNTGFVRSGWEGL